MAYLRALHILCDACHQKPATVELLSRRNESHGRFCAACARPRLARLKADEQRADALLRATR